MRVMHHFGIIHFDIKPQNVMFSPAFCKTVFIDFGYAQIIREAPGYKSFTKFKGTPDYCCQDMKALMYKNQAGHVDCYYNDLNCLKLTLS